MHWPKLCTFCMRYSCFVTRANHPKGWDAKPPAWGRKTTVEGSQKERSVSARTGGVRTTVVRHPAEFSAGLFLCHSSPPACVVSGRCRPLLRCALTDAHEAAVKQTFQSGAIPCTGCKRSPLKEIYTGRVARNHEDYHHACQTAEAESRGTT